MRLNNPLMSREEAALRWRLGLGRYVRDLRLDKGMTQGELCEAVGWRNKQVLSGTVPSDRLEALADAFGVDLAEFAKQVLRYQDAWTYAALFGADAELRQELAVVPQRLARRRGPRTTH